MWVYLCVCMFILNRSLHPVTLRDSKTVWLFDSQGSMMEENSRSSHPSVNISSVWNLMCFKNYCHWATANQVLKSPPFSPVFSTVQSGSRRSNFSSNARRQQQRQQQQNNANSMMQQQHGGHGQQEALPSHCVSPMSQGGQGSNVGSQQVPDPHQVRSVGRGWKCDVIYRIRISVSSHRKWRERYFNPLSVAVQECWHPLVTLLGYCFCLYLSGTNTDT